MGSCASSSPADSHLIFGGWTRRLSPVSCELSAVGDDERDPSKTRPTKTSQAAPTPPGDIQDAARNVSVTPDLPPPSAVRNVNVVTADLPPPPAAGGSVSHSLKTEAGARTASIATFATIAAFRKRYNERVLKKRPTKTSRKAPEAAPTPLGATQDAARSVSVTPDLPPPLAVRNVNVVTTGVPPPPATQSGGSVHVSHSPRTEAGARTASVAAFATIAAFRSRYRRLVRLDATSSDGPARPRSR